MPKPLRKPIPIQKKVEVPNVLPFDPKKLPEPDFVMPDFMEPQFGWRAWAVDAELPDFGLPPKLFSVSWGYYWAPKKKSAAECNRPYKCSEPVKKHDIKTGEEVEYTIGVPGEHCSCGFYSAKTFEHLQSMGYHQYYENSGRYTVVGKVYCWGKVIECQTGWRAEYAYPAKLFVPIEASYLAIPLAKAYAPKEGVVLRNVLDQGGINGEPRRLKRLADFEKRGERKPIKPRR